MVKTVGTFMLILFVMSVTGAAACSGSSCKATTCSAITAKADSFSFSPCKKCGNVLSNDKGSGLKVTTTGTLKTSKGSKVSMKGNGYFCYYPKSCSKGTITDTFTYKVKNSCGKTATAKVTIKYKCKC